ncbi:hypothetical protein B0H10DRAFT_2014172 [Mycena sp. CBHHK59/15]|nr:hypothetical protein B0H10DRAFT_2014172 [Mycena sp. CBHHK59/15]
MSLLGISLTFDLLLTPFFGIERQQRYWRQTDYVGGAGDDALVALSARGKWTTTEDVYGASKIRYLLHFLIQLFPSHREPQPSRV